MIPRRILARITTITRASSMCAPLMSRWQIETLPDTRTNWKNKRRDKVYFRLHLLLFLIICYKMDFSVISGQFFLWNQFFVFFELFGLSILCLSFISFYFWLFSCSFNVLCFHWLSISLFMSFCHVIFGRIRSQIIFDLLK